MKNNITIAVLVTFFNCATTMAQIGKWIIPAQYEKIRVDNLTNFVYGTSSDSTFVWNREGHLLFNTNNKVYHLTEYGEEAKLIYQGKVYVRDDVEFLSSISEEGKGICVIKHKLFFFDSENGAIRPIMVSSENAKEERQVYISRTICQCR